MNNVRSKHTGSALVDATPLDEFMGNCPDCRLPVRVTIIDESRDHCVITCIHCDGMDPNANPKIWAERIYGVESKGSCDGSCISATGRMCACACGGNNHGKVWGQTRKYEATATAIEKFYAKEKRVIERRERKDRKKREAVEQTYLEWYESLDVDQRRIVDFIARYDNVIAYGLDSMFMLDMRLQIVDSHPYIDEDVVIKSKPLSVKQLAAVVRSVERQWSFIIRDIDERKDAKPVVEGRYEVIGTVLSAKYDDEWGSFKILVKTTTGFKIWGNCPRNLIDEGFISESRNYRAYNGPSGYSFKLGLVIKMTASIKKSQRDEYFGLFKIAKNARIISTETEQLAEAPENVPEKIVDKPATVVETARESVAPKRSGSHSTCTHEATKSARAKCRRDRGK